MRGRGLLGPYSAPVMLRNSHMGDVGAGQYIPWAFKYIWCVHTEIPYMYLDCLYI